MFYRNVLITSKTEAFGLGTGLKLLNYMTFIHTVSDPHST